MKIKVKSKDCSLMIQMKTSFGENLDEKILDNFSRVYLRGFLKARKIKKNHVEYTGPIGISLYERLKKPISKREFLFVVEHVIFAVQKLQNAKLPIEPLVTDLQNVYFNENTKELHFLYVPLTNTKIKNDVWEMLNTIIYSAKPMQENDMDYISRLHYFLAGMKDTNIDTVEKFILKEDRSVVNTIKKHSAGQSGFMTNDYGHYHEHYNHEDDEKTGLLEVDEKINFMVEEEATSILFEEEATGILYEDVEETALLIEETEFEEATGLLIEEDTPQQEVHFPTLDRVLTGERISVNKAVFRLGKEKSYVDYFVNNNNAVSRSHADIIVRGKSYYIKDLNSKNHTYVNNQKIPVQVEMQIYDGDTIKLGNEEFVFYE